MPASLERLPLDILLYMTIHLNLQDLVSLSRTCRNLKSAIFDEEIVCKGAVEKFIAYSDEGLRLKAELKLSGKCNYREALLGLVLRRESLANCDPEGVAVLAYGSANFLFNQGMLVYQADGRIRILDTRISSLSEQVVDIQDLLASPQLALTDPIRPQLQGMSTLGLLNYCENTLTCLYKVLHAEKETRAWLIVLNIGSHNRQYRPPFKIELNSVNKIFVRNNQSHLVYGIHSLDNDGGREWCFNKVCLDDTRVDEEVVPPRNFVGSETDANVSFAVHKNYFYAISSQRVLEEIDFTSCYHCIRFQLLASPCEMRENLIWRRNHIEGPIDDRWSDLRLQTDESDGNLMIVEGRKEWPMGKSASQRAYYIQSLKTKSQDWQIPGESGHEDRLSQTHELINQYKTLMTPEDCPTYRPPQPRFPSNVHRGDNHETSKTFVLSKTKHWTYNPGANAWLDLVDDGLRNPKTGLDSPCLRIRVGARSQLSPHKTPGESFLPSTQEGNIKSIEELGSQPITEEMLHRYTEPTEPLLWPPLSSDVAMVASGAERVSQQDLQEINDVMNPIQFGFSYGPGDVIAKSDGHCLIYSTPCSIGGASKRALIMVNFDASITIPSGHGRSQSYSKFAVFNQELMEQNWFATENAQWTKISKRWSKRKRQ
ncbi:MAG: hypothetical protein M1814_005498 [Vezdaea aestivalis]|nr:MAG: hypothetical protein M1814_005498 [Vezdaea aestivalis]